MTRLTFEAAARHSPPLRQSPARVGGQLTVALWRGREDGGLVIYTVPRHDNQTVLDVVTWVQRHLDPTLSYRYACRVGMCGSCAMTVNGAPRWTCRTHVSKTAADGRLTIGPLRNFPIVKDLAADLTAFFERWRTAKGSFEPTSTRADPVAQIAPSEPARQAIDAAIECINCGICHAACDTVAWSPEYLGPGPLNRAWTLVNDQRDDARRERLAAVSGTGGCHSCHSHQSCQQLCPKALNPTASIAGLKRLTARAFMRGEL